MFSYAFFQVLDLNSGPSLQGRCSTTWAAVLALVIVVFPECMLFKFVSLMYRDSLQLFLDYIHYKSLSLSLCLSHCWGLNPRPHMLYHWATSPTHKSLFIMVFSVNEFLLLETRSCYIVQAGLKLTILLPLPLKYWNYSHRPPCLVKVYSLYSNVLFFCD
jgi:hypothetical protein